MSGEHPEGTEIVIPGQDVAGKYWLRIAVLFGLGLLIVLSLAFSLSMVKKDGTMPALMISPLVVLSVTLYGSGFFVRSGNHPRELRLRTDGLTIVGFFERAFIRNEQVASIRRQKQVSFAMDTGEELVLLSGDGRPLAKIPSQFRPVAEMEAILVAWFGGTMPTLPPEARIERIDLPSLEIPPGWNGWTKIWLTYSILGVGLNLVRIPIQARLLLAREAFAVRDVGLSPATQPILSMVAIFGAGLALVAHIYGAKAFSGMRQRRLGSRGKALLSSWLILLASCIITAAVIAAMWPPDGVLFGPMPDAMRLRLSAPIIRALLLRLFAATIPIVMIRLLSSDAAHREFDGAA